MADEVVIAFDLVGTLLDLSALDVRLSKGVRGQPCAPGMVCGSAKVDVLDHRDGWIRNLSRYH